MREPPVAVQTGSLLDRRNSGKLVASPGSYFIARARDLVLAPAYFRDRLPEDSYTTTADRHYHNLCGATYAAMMSAFELMWKVLYAKIIDAVPLYDDSLLDAVSTKNAVTTESVLAHREVGSVGGMIASSLGTWQTAETINGRYQDLLEYQPIAGDDREIVNELWQVRHVIVHNAGVVGPLDEYRLRGSGMQDKPLQLDAEYLEEAESELARIATSGVEGVGQRVLEDFVEELATGDWESDESVFEVLYRLAKIVGRNDEIPSVDEGVYEEVRAELRE